MAHWKFIDNGYVVAIGKGKGNTEITETEYNTILNVIHNKPEATVMTDYRLREDLTWEAYEVDPPEPEPELTDTEALAIILGGAL